jgi:hypothetical protein
MEASESRGAVPMWAREMSHNHLADVMARSGVRPRDEWTQDLDESFRTAYVLTLGEEWRELDKERVHALVDQASRAMNQARLAVGSDAVDPKAELTVWLSLLLLGLVHEADEWSTLRYYLFTQPSYLRLDHLRPIYEMIGAHISKIGAADRETWEAFNYFAWQDGVVLGLMDRTGIARQARPGRSRAGGDDDAPLSGELFAADPQRYRGTAAQLAQMTAHRVPDVARGLYWQLAERIVEGTRVGDYARLLQDTFEAGYVMGDSEAWAELDDRKMRELMELSLDNVIRERDSRDPSLLPKDPEYRIRNVAIGIVGQLPECSSLTRYVTEQPSYRRISDFMAFMVAVSLQEGAVKRRHRSRLREPLAMSGQQA